MTMCGTTLRSNLCSRSPCSGSLHIFQGPRLRQEPSAMAYSLCHLDPGQFNLRSRTGADGAKNGLS